jgi:predicted acylesterase/phospholipase RssA
MQPPGFDTWLKLGDAEIAANFSGLLNREHHYLALSGGGADGAYGAGILVGWTAAGTRPEFTIVTGTSTGALIAPFAFLGPRYDPVLRKLYTELSTADLVERRSLFDIVRNESATSSAPLRRLLEQYIDDAFVAELAEQHRRGRSLLIGTTNLDACRSVIWDIGAIASSGHPRALELIRSIMLASAAIPAAFPPVLIDVEADGQRCQEMHDDGGAMPQVFLYPPSVRLAEQVQRARRLYIIRNARLDPEWADVQRRTLPIAGRAIASLIATQGIGDLYRLYLQAQRDGLDYNLAFIPPTFRAVPKEVFDRDYMNQLYEVGYDLARHGYPWQKTPPGWNATAAPE